MSPAEAHAAAQLPLIDLGSSPEGTLGALLTNIVLPAECVLFLLACRLCSLEHNCASAVADDSVVTAAAGGAPADTMAHGSQDRHDAAEDEAGAASRAHEQGFDCVEDADQPDEHVPLGDDDDSVVNGSDSGGVSPEGGAPMPTGSDRVVDEVCSWPHPGALT